MGTYSLKKGKANTVLSKTKNYNQNNSLNGSK